MSDKGPELVEGSGQDVQEAAGQGPELVEGPGLDVQEAAGQGPELVEGPGLAAAKRSRSPQERQQIAAAALDEAERTVREHPPARRSSPRHADRADEAEAPDPRDERGRREGVRLRRRGAEPDPDREPGPDADPEPLAREIVLRKLAAQPRSRSELAKALKQRDVPDDVASVVLDRMEEVRLVDDEAFAESWVQSRQSRRGLSRRALRQELVRKGVTRDDIDNALSQVEPDDELTAATALAQKKLRSMSGLERQVKYRRLAGALARRGFSPGLTSQVLSSVLDASDEADG